MVKIFSAALISIFSCSFMAGCGHDITSNFETVRTKNIELTDGSETLAKITAAKDDGGKVILTVEDKNGNLIGTISTK